MRLEAGQLLAHYEVVGSLGKGGMGEVYRARDTRLEREVAIKVLPEALVENEEQLARFEREARLLAALNHPNVATIFGVDHVDGIHFLTLELVPGETLAERVARGPIPVTEAIKIAQQVAGGLEAAHASGIVHRDLKPANIIVRPDGSVKILDFGLAKQTGASDKADQPPVTQAFQVMGTPGYLSPEQARGEETDRRADVWAFGCILYECLAGAKAFPGKTFSECIRMVFEESPDLEALPLETPPTVRLLVSRCLSKDSRTRLRNIGDVKLLLEGAINEPSTMVSGPIVIEKPVGGKHSRVLAVCLGVAVVVAGVLAVLLLRGGNGGAVPTVGAPTTLGLPHGTKLGWRATSANLSKLGTGSPMLAISPDGRNVAYCVDDEAGSRIYVHEVGEFEGRPLDGTENARAPFFSPDGRRVGFLASDSVLKHVPIAGGGAPDRVCEIDSPNFSACWMPDGNAIVYATATGLWLVRLGREPELRQLTDPRLRDDEVEHSDPAVLPDGEHILFTVATGTESHIAMASGKTNDWEIVIPNAASARYAQGRLLFARGAAIRMVAFDPESAYDLGVSQPLRAGVYTTPSSGGGRVITHYDVTADGTLVYAPATAKSTTSTAYWVDRDKEGVGTEIRSGEGDWKHARLSPDESRFAFDILHETGVKDVYTLTFGRGAPVRFTEDGMSIMSAFTPGGRITARSTHRKDTLREFESLGAEPVELPSVPGVDSGTVYADGWSRDGKILILTVRDGKEFSLWHYVRGEEAPRPLLDKQSPRYGRLSPDGRWVAYVAKPDDRLEVFVTAYPEPGELFPVSTGGGGEPVWSHDGQELFYRRADGAMLVVEVQADGEKFASSEAKVLFTNEYDPEPGGHQHYDVFRDGQRFLMIENKRLPPVVIHLVPHALADADTG